MEPKNKLPKIRKPRRTITISARWFAAFITAFVVVVLTLVFTFGWAILRINGTTDKLADQQVITTKQQAQIKQLFEENKLAAKERSIKNCEIQNGFSLGVRGFLIGLGQQNPNQPKPTQAQADLYNKLLDANFPVRDCPKLNDKGEAPLIPSPIVGTTTTTAAVG